jgi:Arc/MetJ-type ribon-helix-helix transcriptional regulator
VVPLAAIGGFMDVVQIQLPDDLKQIIDRQVAEGRAANQADYVEALHDRTMKRLHGRLAAGQKG